MAPVILNTILIIGATSGIGAGLARRLHAQGKTVIAAGRRLDRLAALKEDLPGLYTTYFDISDIDNLPHAIADITRTYPDISTLIVAAGIQSYFSLHDPVTTIPPTAINQEITTNITGPILLCNQLVPFFLKKNTQSSICLISSGLAFVPVPTVSVYSATKSAIHSFSVSLRAALHDTKIKVTEIAPPYVDTELDKEFQERKIQDMGGPDKAPKPMALEDFLDKLMQGFSEEKDEIGVLMGDMLFQTWRNAFGDILEKFNIKG